MAGACLTDGACPIAGACPIVGACCTKFGFTGGLDEAEDGMLPWLGGDFDNTSPTFSPLEDSFDLLSAIKLGFPDKDLSICFNACSIADRKSLVGKNVDALCLSATVFDGILFVGTDFGFSAAVFSIDWTNPLPFFTTSPTTLETCLLSSLPLVIVLPPRLDCNFVPFFALACVLLLSGAICSFALIIWPLWLCLSGRICAFDKGPELTRFSPLSEWAALPLLSKLSLANCCLNWFSNVRMLGAAIISDEGGNLLLVWAVGCIDATADRCIGFTEDLSDDGKVFPCDICPECLGGGCTAGLRGICINALFGGCTEGLCGGWLKRTCDSCIEGPFDGCTDALCVCCTEGLFASCIEILFGGCTEGLCSSCAKGICDGCTEGLCSSCNKDICVGCTDGLCCGCTKGICDGCTEGLCCGCTEGLCCGCTEGTCDGCTGDLSSDCIKGICDNCKEGLLDDCPDGMRAMFDNILRSDSGWTTIYLPSRALTINALDGVDWLVLGAIFNWGCWPSEILSIPICP